jgi:nucleotide-binding universal stress UspA family protein
MFHKIMVAYDESSEAFRALRASIELAKTLSAELSVVAVLEPIPGYCSFAVSAYRLELDRGKAGQVQRTPG